MSHSTQAQSALRLAYSEIDEAETLEERLARFHLQKEDFKPMKGLLEYRREVRFLYRLTFDYGVWNQNVQKSLASWNARMVLLGLYNAALLLGSVAGVILYLKR